MVVEPAVLAKDQKMLGRFLTLALPRFSSIPGEDAYEFLIFCENKLHNLSLVDTQGVY